MSIESIAAIVGTLGGFELVKYLVNLFVNRKSNRRVSNADADKAEAEADALIVKTYEERLKSEAESHEKAVHLYEERLKELRASNTELNAQLLTIVKEKARKDEILDDKVAQIRKLNEDLIGCTKKGAELDKKLQYYKNWKCFREYGKGKSECTRREPKQNPPLKYSPLDDDNDSKIIAVCENTTPDSNEDTKENDNTPN